MSGCAVIALMLRYWDAGHDTICGVDEAGRGPLAGELLASVELVGSLIIHDVCV